MQANGAEMLRLACIMGTEEGIEICAPVHDALLICAPLEDLDARIARMREIMAEASSIILNGFVLNTDVDVVRYPDRYMDPRGEVMWAKVTELLDSIDEIHPLPDDTPNETRGLTGSAGPSITLSI